MEYYFHVQYGLVWFRVLDMSSGRPSETLAHSETLGM